MSPFLSAVTEGVPPAGGAAFTEIVIASVAAAVVTAGLLVVGIGHRRGTVPYLGRLAALSERASGQPGWAALPAAVASGALLIAVFGMYWDIALHIGVGRDEGPLANPAHYFILIGLYGIFSAGFLAMVLPRGRASTTAIRISRDWHAPLGGVLICACGAFSLVGFPLDDVWHRLFGQDVTLWGPTHLMLIGGASMTLVGIAVLQVEGMRANAAAGASRERHWVHRLRIIALTGGFLVGLSTFQAEFDFGVPQFRFVFQPMLIMLAAGGALVAARVWLGRGAALGAVAFYLLIRGGLAVFVGPVFGEPTPHLPTYLAEAVIVELVALVIARERPLALGAWCGVLIGTVGLAAEWGWSHVWMPLPWPSQLLPEAAILGFAMALAGSIIGAWIGTRLGSDILPRTRSLRAAGAVAAAGVAAMIAFAMYTPEDGPAVSATVAVEEVRGGPERTVNATLTLRPRDAGRDADWITVTAWQGGGLVVDRLREVGAGVYETTRPIPVHGDWKSIVRLHEGNALTGVPIYLPADAAIPAQGVPATARFARTFVPDHKILQREQRSTAGTLPLLAYGVVLALALGLLALLAWGLHRLAVHAPRRVA
ncbi:MAG: hypothetical protein H0T43_10860, partial [Solirubrobacterales bacterium]|nr:hypothetical protein [Solirubrobacterales bacterium]